MSSWTRSGQRWRSPSRPKSRPCVVPSRNFVGGARDSQRKSVGQADFFFVPQTNDQCSLHQHPRPATDTNRKDSANAQASPRDGT